MSKGRYSHLLSLKHWSIVGLAVCSGCGTNVIDKENAVGVSNVIADSTLSDEDKAKQETLSRILNAFQEGIADASDLQFVAGSVDFQENVASFYSGRKRLYRWKYLGLPKNDDFEVEFTLDDQAFGVLDTASAKVETRKYRVTNNGYGYGFTIARAE